MQEIPKELKCLLFGRGARWLAWEQAVLCWLGLGCFIVGIIGDAINRIPGLEPTHWFIMAAALWVWGLWKWIAAYTAAKEG